MSNDPWQQLAAVDVPPLPAHLESEVHQRLNKRLLVVHLSEFALRVAPYAIGQLLPGLVSWLTFTLTGKFEPPRREPPAL